MPGINALHMAIARDKELRESKPNYSARNAAIALQLGTLAGGTYLLGKKAVKNSNLGSKITDEVRISGKVKTLYDDGVKLIPEKKTWFGDLKKLKENLNKFNIQEKWQTFAQKEGWLAKNTVKAAKGAKKTGIELINWVSKLPKAGKFLAGGLAILIGVNHINKKGQIEGAHKAVNAIARAEIYSMMDTTI